MILCERRRYESFSREGDQSDPIPSDACQKPGDSVFGRFKPLHVPLHILGEHASGEIKGDEKIDRGAFHLHGKKPGERSRQGDKKQGNAQKKEKAFKPALFKIDRCKQLLPKACGNDAGKPPAGPARAPYQ